MTAAATAVAQEKAMVGQPAPDFEMASTKNIEKLNEPVKLSDYRGKWVVMVFYPLDFTFVCPTELTTFSAIRIFTTSVRRSSVFQLTPSIRIAPG